MKPVAAAVAAGMEKRGGVGWPRLEPATEEAPAAAAAGEEPRRGVVMGSCCDGVDCADEADADEAWGGETPCDAGSPPPQEGGRSGVLSFESGVVRLLVLLLVSLEGGSGFGTGARTGVVKTCSSLPRCPSSLLFV